MKLFDTLYYAIYRFGRSIGQPHLQAKACAGNFMPFFFVVFGFCLYVILAYKYYPQMLPPKSFKTGFEILGAAVLILSYIIYVKRGRGQKVIAEYGKSKNQNFYQLLGVIFSVVSLSGPIWIYFLWSRFL